MMAKLRLKSSYLNEMEISNILEELYEKYNEESQYATLIDKTKAYISGMEFADDEKINIINALELQICDSYRMDAANLIGFQLFSALISGLSVGIVDKLIDLKTNIIVRLMAYILFVFFLVFGLYVLFSILKNQIVIKTEYYKKKKYLETCIKILKL